MKYIVLISTSLLLLTSCATKRLQVSKLDHSVTYSKAQSDLINTGAIDDPMRIWLITSQTDSILLRTKSTDIDIKKDFETTKLLSERLITTVQDPANAGVGIAAPQVGILKNMIVVQRFDKEEFPFETYINPKILQYSKKTQLCNEGCLSIPNKMNETNNRSYAILLKYEKLDGSHKIEMVEDFTAVIFQHEIDHLNGILFIDHLKLEIEETKKRSRNEKE